jgi:hypothetical protein
VEARPNALFDPAWLGRVVSEKQAELLGRYRAVLFAEVDEIVIPRQGSLRQSVAAFARETEEGGADAAATEAAAAGAAAATEAAAAGAAAGAAAAGAAAAGAAVAVGAVEAKAGVALPPAVACTGWEMHHDFGAEPATSTNPNPNPTPTPSPH